MNIAFSQEPVIAFSMGHQHSNIFLTDAEGKLEPLNITQKEAVGQRNGHPTWSPDGTRIAFDSNRKSKANYEIFVIDTDGANLKNLTKSEKDDKEPAWSPDGKSIVFTSNRNGGNWDIYKMNIDEQNVVRLTDDTAKDDRASWSPDGKQIAFTSTREGKGAGIYLMDAIDGQNIKRIVKAGVAPYWSPDSMKIVFTAPAQPLRLAIWDLVKKKEMDTGIVAHIYFPSWKGSQWNPIDSANRMNTLWGVMKQ